MRCDLLSGFLDFAPDQYLSLRMKEFDFSSEQLSEKLSELKTKTASLSIFRVLSFFGVIGFFILGISESPVWFVLFFGTGAGFVYLVSKYNLMKDQEAIYFSLEKMESNRELRKARKLKSFEPGLEYQNKSHPFSNDLDLFGDHSLFQLLNHTVSKEGKNKLSGLITSDFDLSKAATFRAATDELAAKPAFLQAMESIGLAFYRDEKSIHPWIKWLKEPEQKKSWVLPFAWIGPIGGLIFIVLAILGIIPAGFYGLWVLLGMGLLGLVFQSLKKAGDEIPSRNQLKTYRYWLTEIEKQEFRCEGLRNATAGFLEDNIKASVLLEELDRLGLWIQNRMNIIYIPINLLFWTDLLLYVRLQKWKSKYGKLVSEFPEQLATWEMLVSLGTFQYELGGKGEIIIVESGIKGFEIAHPLLSPEIAIPNDFAQDPESSVILLTGANMSGKTTFMRTLGINCVLVNLGLRPFAKAFGFGEFQLYTSMRNTDNLGESVSSFYAELSRIKLLIDRIDAGEEIFFLLDEILKGTNTEDRISGSEALIRQVVDTKALGIISTHDIELAELETRLGKVKNFSFHSEIHDQSIDFDYKLKIGACPSFNAHKLMELMGIRFQS
jgi:hypothetical protein